MSTTPAKETNTVKYTLILTPEQEKQLDILQKGLGLSNRAEVFRKCLNLAGAFLDVMVSNNSIGVVSPEGKIIERWRIL